MRGREEDIKRSNEMSNEEKLILEELLEVMSNRISNLSELVNVLSLRITNVNERIDILVETNREE